MDENEIVQNPGEDREIYFDEKCNSGRSRIEEIKDFDLFTQNILKQLDKVFKEEDSKTKKLYLQCLYEYVRKNQGG